MKQLRKTIALGLMMTTLVACGAKGGEVIKFDSQLDALTQLKNGTVDVAIIDSVMAGYYTNNGDFASSVEIVPNLILSTEQYGIAAKKGNASLIDKVNEALDGLAKNGKTNSIATYFGITSSLVETSYTAKTTTDQAWANIVSSKSLVVGYTVFAPIAYEDSTNNYAGNKFTGFDTELARATVEFLNTKYSTEVAVTFQEIEWDSKEALLTNGTIDLVWNGLTITDERKANMEISNPYLNNNQVPVVKKGDASKFSSKDEISKATIGVESGSAGEDIANELVG